MLTHNDIAKCETWFKDNGLPYFVESGHDAIQRALAPRLVWTWVGLIAGLSVVAGVVVGLTLESWSAAFEASVAAAAVVSLARFARVFRVARIARWAARHSWTNRYLLVRSGRSPSGRRSLRHGWATRRPTSWSHST